jgi:uncharacterized protein
MALRFPCEIIGWYLIPAVRRELVSALVNQEKLERKVVAKKLGLTQAALSQYLKSKRGMKINIPQQSKKKIKEIAKAIAKKEDGAEMFFMEQTCKLCKELRKEMVLCDVCRENHNITNCSLCREG